MKLFSLVIPLLFIGVFLYAAVKKVKIYDAFTRGVQGAVPLIVSIFPYVAAMFMLTELFEQSGLAAKTCDLLSPVLSLLGIPGELGKLLLIKPFSGNGATALLSELIETYGADSYISRCGAVCYGSSETVFYIGAVYFSAVRKNKLTAAIVISLLSSLLAAAAGCFLCRFL